MAAISQTIIDINDNGFAPNRRQVIIWANAYLIHWRIYAALGEVI